MLAVQAQPTNKQAFYVNEGHFEHEATKFYGRDHAILRRLGWHYPPARLISTGWC